MAELSLRICAIGLVSFLTLDGHWLYNVLDLVVVGFQTVHVVHDFFSLHLFGAVHVSCFSTIRLVRIARLIPNMIKEQKELRKLSYSLLHSMKSLGWVMLLLIAMVYILGVYLTQVVTEYKVSNRSINWDTDSNAQALQQQFGTLDRSMLSLYAVVSDGTHWTELSQPMAQCISPWMPLVFFLFSSVALLAVMNTVTAVFVESVVQAAEMDEKHNFVKKISEMFNRLDRDGNGVLNFAEFKVQLEDKDMRTYLAELELEPEDAEELFRLLDYDYSGTMDIDELVNGSLRLIGYAKAIDLATFMHEYRLSSHRLEQHAQYMEQCVCLLLENIANPIDRNAPTAASKIEKLTRTASRLPALRSEG